MPVYRLGMNEKQQELLIKFLEENNIEYESYLTPLHMFFEEEAEFRITLNFEDEVSEEKLDELIETYKDDLAAEFFDRENILDCDLLDDITREIVGNV